MLLQNFDSMFLLVWWHMFASGFSWLMVVKEERRFTGRARVPLAKIFLRGLSGDGVNVAWINTYGIWIVLSSLSKLSSPKHEPKSKNNLLQPCIKREHVLENSSNILFWAWPAWKERSFCEGCTISFAQKNYAERRGTDDRQNSERRLPLSSSPPSASSLFAHPINPVH